VTRASTSGDPLIGRIVAGKFRVESLIGEGGMGMVYKATQVNLDKTIVLKVLRPSLISDERTVQRFQREARAASRLNHPNSIAVIDFGQSPEDGSMYIAMEYCAGHDLHHLLSHERLDETRIVRIVSQVLSALAEAHAHGVIHRDLKPENIMVEQRRGEPDFVKVLDFGIAKITDNTGEEGQALTRAGFVCGTPEYMSPEQAKGATIDARSDLYAVGVILYQLVTGLLPFDSESAVGFATAHLTQQVPPLRKRNPEARCSPGLERLIMSALAKDPEQRPQSAEAFRNLLMRPLSGTRAPVMLESDSDRTAVNSGPAWNDRTPAEPNRNVGVPAEPTHVRPERGAQPKRPRMSGGAYLPAAAPPATGTATATSPNTSPETSGMGSGPRVVLALSGLGLVVAFGFFVHEFFLAKPPAPVIEPVATVVIPQPVVPVQPSHPVSGSTGAAPTSANPGKPAAPEIPLTALSGDPERAQTLIEHARSEVKQGKVKEALALAQQAYGNDPSNLAVVRSYAEIASFVAMNDTSQKPLAIELYQKLSSRPDLSDRERKLVSLQLKRLGATP